MINRIEVCNDETDGEYTESNADGRFIKWEDVRQEADKAVAALKLCQSNGDTEAAHADADYVLIDLIWELGLSDVLEEYNKVAKWLEKGGHKCE